MDKGRPVRAGARLAAALLCLTLLAGFARAHAPHDAVSRVAVSPAFAQDQLVLGYASLIDQRVILRSQDGGRTVEHVGGPLAFHGVSTFAFSPDVANDGVVFAGSGADGVYRSDDRGRSWAPAGSALRGVGVTDLAVSPHFASDGVILASTHVGLFRSADGGASWSPVTTGLTELDLTALGIGLGPGGPVAFCAGLVVHRSDDLGLSWQAQSPLGSTATGLEVSALFAQDATALLCQRLDGVRVTTDGGQLWRPFNGGLTDPVSHAVALSHDGDAFLATPALVFQTSDLSGPWAPTGPGLGPLDPDASKHYLDVAVAPGPGAPWFVAALEGLFRSDDAGASWAQADVFHGLVDLRLAISPNYSGDRELFVGGYGGGVKRWREPPSLTGGRAGPQAGPPGSVSAGVPTGPGGGGGVGGSGGGPALGSGAGGGVSQQPWDARANGINGPWCDGLAISPDYAQDATLFFCYLGLFRSTDGGGSWTKLVLPPGSNVVREVALSPDYAVDRTLIAGTNGAGVHRSVDGGETWTTLGGGLPVGVKTRRVRFSPDFARDRTVFLASWKQGLWRSTDGGDTWVELGDLPTGDLRALALSPYFARDATLLVGTAGEGLHRSEDGGDSFTPVTAGLPGGAVVVASLAFSPPAAGGSTAGGRVALAGTMAGQLLRSEDGGASWSLASAALDAPARDLVFSPGFSQDRTAFAATHDGVWRTRDGGHSWQRLPAWARVDDDDQLVRHEGAWMVQAASDVHAKGVTTTTQAGAAVSYSVRATRLAWYAPRGPDMAVVELLVDGVPAGTVDLYAPQPEPSALRFVRAFGSEGWHTLRVQHTGLTHPDAVDARVPDDGFSWWR